MRFFLPILQVIKPTKPRFFMRQLTADIYKIIYKVIDRKLIALPAAIVYVSLLNVITLYGLSVLLSGWVSWMNKIKHILNSPAIYLVFLLVAGINFLMLLPLQNLSKEKSRPYALTPVLIYSLVSFLLFFYVRFADRIF